MFNSQAQTSFIYDKYGTLVTEFSGTENRINVTLDEVPQNLIDAVIAVEDARFYEHNGVDVKRIVGAFVQNLLNNSMQGGCTITQQLIKLTMLSSEQTYKRKLQEAYLALQLEEQVSKEQILQEYLNTIFMGGSVYGVKAAALDYFGKDLVELSLRECAMLAQPQQLQPPPLLLHAQHARKVRGRRGLCAGIDVGAGLHHPGGIRPGHE